MPTWPRADPERRSSSFLLRAAIVAFVAVGVLAMHALTGGFASGAAHADMSHGDTAGTAAGSAVVVAVTHSSRDGDGSLDAHCGVATVCLALVGMGLLLLGAARTRRPLLARRRAAATSSLRRLLAMARLPDPPDLHSLSILRC